jgi:Prokaryotic phospholipase A2
MDRRRFARITVVSVIAAAAALGFAPPASASTAGDRATVLSDWTQPPVASYNAWYAARTNRAAWVSYHFDWSTDYCSDSPDAPLGFDFRLACARHDFGYRNYRAAGQLPAAKVRVDSAFYADLERDCATYNVWVRPSCDSLAWTYYKAVRVFGSVVVSQADLARAAVLKNEGAARARAA